MPLQVVNIGGSVGRPRRRRARRRSGFGNIDPNTLLLLGLNRFFDQQDSGEEFSFLREQLAQQGDQFTASLADSAEERKSRFDLSVEANRSLAETAQIAATGQFKVIEKQGENVLAQVAQQGESQIALAELQGNQQLAQQRALFEQQMKAIIEARNDPEAKARAEQLNVGNTLAKANFDAQISASGARALELQSEEAGNVAVAENAAGKMGAAEQGELLRSQFGRLMKSFNEDASITQRIPFNAIVGNDRRTEAINFVTEILGNTADRSNPELARASLDFARQLRDDKFSDLNAGFFRNTTTKEQNEGTRKILTEMLVNANLSGTEATIGDVARGIRLTPDQARLRGRASNLQKRVDFEAENEARLRDLLTPKPQQDLGLGPSGANLPIGAAGSPFSGPIAPSDLGALLGPLGGAGRRTAVPQETSNPQPTSTTTIPQAAPAPLIGPGGQTTGEQALQDFIRATQPQPQPGPISQAVDVQNLGQQLALRKMQELGLLA